MIAYLRRRHDPLMSLVLTVPVFLVYHLGILFMELRNGADLVSSLMFELISRSPMAYAGLTLAYAAALVGTAFFLKGAGHVTPSRWLPLILESTVWAFLMAVTVGWATQQVFHVGAIAGQASEPSLWSRIFDLSADTAALGSGFGPFDKIVMSAGAGFHEELVFRVLLLGGGIAFFKRMPLMGETRAFVVGLVVSSLVFSAVHYVGSLGDDFSLVSFGFRFFAGAFLGLLYYFRGFAVAVYTHTIYDLWVMFVIGG